MELHNNTKTFQARDRAAWRRWLEKNHEQETAVWLIIYHKTSATKTVYYDEAVEEAICFGWIDSIAHKRDEESKYQFFAKRKPKSNWSKANRARAEKMIAQGRMQPAGQAAITHAKKTGSWTALEQVQSSVVPPDLEAALNKNKTARSHFDKFPPSSKRIILEWILNAKKPETRANRIAETVSLAADNIRANHYRQ
ncbi:MAG: YdeI/OmpD-associated family protein [Bacteroidota bacterium]|nr:YdeI/OmpD-associated family protein [Bacteroidota bacterium]